jgi:putative phage-type endonuclease
MDHYEIIGDSADREHWLDLRRQGIGGSDAPAILGLVAWASPASIQADKWGLSDEPDEAEVMRWGRRLEEAIRRGLADDERWDLEPFGLLLRSRARPWQLCTPDARRADGLFVQIKNTVKAEDWRDQVPEAVYVQCQHEMAVTGHARCIAAALILGNRLRWAYVERDQAFIEDVLLPAEEAFWKATLASEPVAADGSEHTRRAYERLWPQDSGESVLLDGHFLDLDVEREELRTRMAECESRLNALDNEIRLAMKHASTGILPNGVSFTLKTQHRKEYVAKASTFRVLRRIDPRKKKRSSA